MQCAYNLSDFNISFNSIILLLGVVFITNQHIKNDTSNFFKIKKMVFTELKKVIPTSFELRNHTIFKMIFSVNIVTKTSLHL